MTCGLMWRAPAVGDVRIGQVDVDRGRDVLDEDAQAVLGLLRVAGGLDEGAGPAAKAPEQDGCTKDECEGTELGDGNDRRLDEAIEGVRELGQPERGQDDGAAEQAGDSDAVGGR